MPADPQSPATLAKTLTLAGYQTTEIAPAVLAAFPGTSALAIGQALLAAASGIVESTMRQALEACSYKPQEVTAALQALYQVVLPPVEPPTEWAGSYVTETQWWGGYFSPLIIGTDGKLTVAGQAISYSYDPETSTLSWDWQDIKTTRAKASFSFAGSGPSRSITGTLNPRPQDGPVRFSGRLNNSAAAWPARLNGSSNNARSGFLGPREPGIAWTRNIAANMRGGPVCDSEGNIYVGGDNAQLSCIDPDGSIKWSFKSNYPFYPTPTVGPDGTIYGLSDSVQAIVSGTKAKWTYQRRDIGMVITTAGVLTADGATFVFVAGSSTGKGYRLIALDTANGAARWEMPFTQGSSCMPAIGGDGTVYVGSEECILYAVNPADGSVKWRHQETGGDMIRGSVALDDNGNIYFCKSAQNPSMNDLVCLNPDGSEKWRYRPAGEYLANPPSIAIGFDGTVFAGFYGLHAVTPAGVRKWRSSTVANDGIYPGPIVVDRNGAVYYGTGDGKLLSYAADGRPVWQWQIGVNNTGVALMADGRLCFGGPQSLMMMREGTS